MEKITENELIDAITYLLQALHGVQNDSRILEKEWFWAEIESIRDLHGRWIDESMEADRKRLGGKTWSTRSR